MKALLLDRDKTLNEDPGYLNDPGRVVLLPGVAEGLRRFQSAGFSFYVLTNQSGVGRGLISPDQLKAVNKRIESFLNEAGIFIEKFYICPHTDEDGCNCRKPKPGLVEQSIKENNLDPANCIIAGDRYRDLAAGESAGIPGILLTGRPGAGEDSYTVETGNPPSNLRWTVTDLNEAADLVL